VSVNDLVLVQGMHDTKQALARWNREPWRVLGPWLGLSVLIAFALVLAIYAVARLSTPDPTVFATPGYNVPAGLEDYLQVLFRNSLVLALHALACVAGFIAGGSLPLAAEHRSGLSRRIHEKAGPLAIGFVVCATLFSLATQAFVIGGTASSIAAHVGVGPGTLLLALAPHALPELVALFLPLAAWMIASRRGEWRELLAATFVTVAVAVPVLLAAAAIEIWVSPHLLAAVSS
jgi:Stage II sporulation protein M